MDWIKNLVAKIVGKKIAKELNATEEGSMDTKKWYASKGVQGGAVGVLVGLYALVQIFIGPAIGKTFPDIPEWVFRLIEGIIGTGGGALAIYGRIKAEKPIN